jgi:hypothetical protein
MRNSRADPEAAHYRGLAYPYFKPGHSMLDFNIPATLSHWSAKPKNPADILGAARAVYYKVHTTDRQVPGDGRAATEAAVRQVLHQRPPAQSEVVHMSREWTEDGEGFGQSRPLHQAEV